jgi:hypothetical protein
MADYQMSLSREIEARLKDKCDKLGDAFIMDDIGRLSLSLCEIKIAHVCPHDVHIRDVFPGG